MCFQARKGRIGCRNSAKSQMFLNFIFMAKLLKKYFKAVEPRTVNFGLHLHAGKRIYVPKISLRLSMTFILWLNIQYMIACNVHNLAVETVRRHIFWPSCLTMQAHNIFSASRKIRKQSEHIVALQVYIQ